MMEEESVLNLLSTVNEKKSNVFVAKTKNEILAKKLEELTSELLEAKSSHVQLRIAAEQAFQTLNCNHIKAVIFKESKRRRAEMCEHLKQISKEECIPQQKKCHQEAQSLAKGFLKESLSAPWIPEKKKLLSELTNNVAELEEIHQELQSINAQILERKELIELHNRYPFRTFCVDIITYCRKSAALKKLLRREIHNNEEMKLRVPEKGVEDSQDYTASQVQSHLVQSLQTQTLSQDLEKSVPENGDEEDVEDDGMESISEENVEVAPEPKRAFNTSALNTSAALNASYLNNDPEESMYLAVNSFMVDDDLTSPTKNHVAIDEDQFEDDDFEKSIVVNNNEQEAIDVDPAPAISSTPRSPTVNLAPLVLNSSPVFATPAIPMSVAATTLPAAPTVSAVQTSKKTEDNEASFFAMNSFNDSGMKNKIGEQSINEDNEFEKSAAGDFMTMLNMVNESQNASSCGGGAFFDLFGGDADKKQSGNDSQESTGGLFNFNFGNSSIDDGQGDGAANTKKSFFDF